MLQTADVLKSNFTPFKLGRMYQTAHQNDGFNALRLCCSKLNPACLYYDSKPAKLHKAR